MISDAVLISDIPAKRRKRPPYVKSPYSFRGRYITRCHDCNKMHSYFWDRKRWRCWEHVSLERRAELEKTLVPLIVAKMQGDEISTAELSRRAEIGNATFIQYLKDPMKGIEFFTILRAMRTLGIGSKEIDKVVVIPKKGKARDVG